MRETMSQGTGRGQADETVEMNLHDPAMAALGTTFSRNMVSLASQSGILALLTGKVAITSDP